MYYGNTKEEWYVLHNCCAILSFDRTILIACFSTHKGNKWIIWEQNRNRSILQASCALLLSFRRVIVIHFFLISKKVNYLLGVVFEQCWIITIVVCSICGALLVGMALCLLCCLGWHGNKIHWNFHFLVFMIETFALAIKKLQHVVQNTHDATEDDFFSMFVAEKNLAVAASSAFV